MLDVFVHFRCNSPLSFIVSILLDNVETYNDTLVALNGVMEAISNETFTAIYNNGTRIDTSITNTNTAWDYRKCHF